MTFEPVPLEEPDMNAKRWRHWVEHVRKIPIGERAGIAYQRGTNTVSFDGFHNWSMTANFDAPFIVYSNVPCNRFSVNGVHRWSKPQDWQRRGNGPTFWLEKEARAGDTLSFYVPFNTYIQPYYDIGDEDFPLRQRTMEVLIEKTGVGNLAYVLGPPHPRLESGDRRWVDHWNTVYTTLNASPGVASIFSDVEESRTNNVTASQTLASLTTTFSGDVEVVGCVQAEKDWFTFPPTGTIKLQKNGADLDTYTHTTATTGVWWDFIMRAEVSVVAGDVLRIYRSMTTSMKQHSSVTAWLKK